MENLEIDINKRASLRRMKYIATGILIVMGIIYSIARFFGNGNILWGSIQAFTEAAMVGALADWFAVTALFRHPLGIPIPHTAIIPQNKDSIGDALGTFVHKFFLTPEWISENIKSWDIVGKSAEWLAVSEHSKEISDELCSLIPVILEAFDDKDVQDFFKQIASSGITSVSFAPFLGDILEILTLNNRYQQIYTETVNLIPKLAPKYLPKLQKEISERSPWYLRIWPIRGDVKIYNKITTELKQKINEIVDDKDQKYSSRFNEVIGETIKKLRTSLEYRRKEEAIKESFLMNLTAKQYGGDIWSSLKVFIIEDIKLPESKIRAGIADALTAISNGLMQNASVRSKLNQKVENLISFMVEKHGDRIVGLISDKIRKWDLKKTSQIMELEVGKDLQYIRISGTVVGGSVGLIIYALFVYLPALIH